MAADSRGRATTPSPLISGGPGVTRLGVLAPSPPSLPHLDPRTPDGTMTKSKFSASSATRKKHAAKKAADADDGGHTDAPGPAQRGQKKGPKKSRFEPKVKSYTPPPPPPKGAPDPVDLYVSAAAGVDPELIVVLRRLGKRDEATVFKGVEGLEKWINEAAREEGEQWEVEARRETIVSIMPVWVRPLPSYLGLLRSANAVIHRPTISPDSPCTPLGDFASPPSPSISPSPNPPSSSKAPVKPSCHPSGSRTKPTSARGAAARSTPIASSAASLAGAGTPSSSSPLPLPAQKPRPKATPSLLKPMLAKSSPSSPPSSSTSPPRATTLPQTPTPNRPRPTFPPSEPRPSSPSPTSSRPPSFSRKRRSRFFTRKTCGTSSTRRRRTVPQGGEQSTRFLGMLSRGRRRFWVIIWRLFRERYSRTAGASGTGGPVSSRSSDVSFPLLPAPVYFLTPQPYRLPGSVDSSRHRADRRGGGKRRRRSRRS